MEPEILRRHAFVRLADDAWEFTGDGSADPAVLRDWIDRDRPLIVRRPCVSAEGHDVFLGLALPGKIRLAYRVPVEAVEAITSPPVWNGPFPSPFTPRLFGSHAWERLTGLDYVTPASDLDLLVDLATSEDWEEFRRNTPPDSWTAPGAAVASRIDLEIIFARDVSFTWREFCNSSADILVKSNQSVWLEPKDRLRRWLA